MRLEDSQMTDNKNDGDHQRRFVDAYHHLRDVARAAVHPLHRQVLAARLHSPWRQLLVWATRSARLAAIAGGIYFVVLGCRSCDRRREQRISSAVVQELRYEAALRHFHLPDGDYPLIAGCAALDAGFWFPCTTAVVSFTRNPKR